MKIALLERRHPPAHPGAIAPELVRILGEAGAEVEVVHAEEGRHRLDRRPPWDLVVLKSGSAAALHLAAAAEAWGIRSVNGVEATRLVRDKLASAAVLQRAGVPIARSRLAWLGPATPAQLLRRAGRRPLAVKAARGSRGEGLWMTEAGGLATLAPSLPEGPYLLMERVPHHGFDLKVYAAGEWLAGVTRVFPAISFEEKLGRTAVVPPEVAETTRTVGRIVGLNCFGCDYVRGLCGWTLVDVNAFPGYKGAPGAAEAVAAEIARIA